MGCVCNKKGSTYGSSHGDSFTGLTNSDKQIIRKTWHKVTEKESFSKAGLTFFARLFAVYPYLQDYFQPGQDRSTPLLHSDRFRATVMKFMYAVTAYVENMDDPEMLESLMKKIADIHCRRNITYDDMLRMKEVFFEFLQELLGKDAGSDVFYAWDKLFSAHLRVYAETLKMMNVQNVKSSQSGKFNNSS